MTRAEFERKFYLLVRTVKKGKLQFPVDLPGVVEGLARLRDLPNGRLDLLSIDETTRSLANTMTQFESMDLAQFNTDAQSQADDFNPVSSPPATTHG